MKAFFFVSFGTNEHQAVLIGQVPPEGDADRWGLQWGTGNEQVKAQFMGVDNSPPTDCYQLLNSNNNTQFCTFLRWDRIPEREEQMYLHAYGRTPENLRGRLREQVVGSFLPFESYRYWYIGPTEFLTNLHRPRFEGVFQASMIHKWNRMTGMFLEMSIERPSYTPNNPDRAREKEVLIFNGEGQVQESRVYDQIGRDQNGQPIFADTPRWSETFEYSSRHLFAITQYRDRENTLWEFEYADSDDILLKAFRVNGGALGQATIEYGKEHEDAPDGGHPNPPTAPTHIQIGSDPALTWRYDYTLGRRPYPNVSENGLLAAFTEPARSGWWRLRYWDEHSLYPNKLREVEDPTGRKLGITAYDFFGRPARLELYPTNSTTPLWSETEWTLFGLPRTTRWGFGSTQSGQVHWEWDGLFLRRYIDPRGRLVRFVYDFDDSRLRNPAGVPRQIWIEGTDGQGNLLRHLYAELAYDDAGRLKRVQNGRPETNNVVGLTYGYGIHDELRFIRHDGDGNAETFDYSCCGRLSRWTRQDGRFATFEYSPNGWLLWGHEHSSFGNAHTQHEYSYDPIGRLGRAVKCLSTLQGWQDQIELRWWYDTDDPSYGVGVDPRNLDSDPQNDLASAHTGWLLGEEVRLLVGAERRSYSWWYEYRTPAGTRTSDLQAFYTSWGSVWRYEYDSAGRPTALLAGNTPFATWSYDNAGRLTNQTVYLSEGRTLTTMIEYADAQVPNAVGRVTYQLSGQPIAQFDYRGTTNEPGYYADGTLRFAREWLASGHTAEWRWDYYPNGSLKSETSRLNGGEPLSVTFAYSDNGNLIQWGDRATDWRYSYNQLWWVGGSHPRGGSYNWYMTYTPNGERARLWNSPMPIEGDANGDGVVDDSDLIMVQFAYGRSCPNGCPEDLNRDGQVDDADLAIVLFNYGQSAGTVSWAYHYDVWGNLVQAVNSEANIRLNAIYDSLGRRVGLQGVRNGTRFEVWRLYEGDTLLAEVDGQGRVIAEYVWGPLGPIARLDRTGEGLNVYYVMDGLGHVRMLVGENGSILEVWQYDSWGVPLSLPENPLPQPFTWNGAYGYEWDCWGGTGLYHAGAREYDPRTGRWLQRDPVDAVSGDPNLYRYCGNDPVNNADPSGLDWLNNASDFFAGWGDTLTFGATRVVRQWIGVDDVVDYCSGWYTAGQAAGIVQSTVMGGTVGTIRNARLAGLSRPNPAFTYGKMKGVEKVERSHWIPRHLLPKRHRHLLDGSWNIKYMWGTEHAKNDPFRHQFMPVDWKNHNKMYPLWRQQLNRVPPWISGGAAGATYGGLSVLWSPWGREDCLLGR